MLTSRSQGLLPGGVRLPARRTGGGGSGSFRPLHHLGVKADVHGAGVAGEALLLGEGGHGRTGPSPGRAWCSRCTASSSQSHPPTGGLENRAVPLVGRGVVGSGKVVPQGLGELRPRKMVAGVADPVQVVEGLVHRDLQVLRAISLAMSTAVSRDWATMILPLRSMEARAISCRLSLGIAPQWPPGPPGPGPHCR